MSAEQRAWAELERLTSAPGGPGAAWRWSIPAKPDHDSDLLLAAGLAAVADERDVATAVLASIAELCDRMLSTPYGSDFDGLLGELKRLTDDYVIDPEDDAEDEQLTDSDEDES